MIPYWRDVMLVDLMARLGRLLALCVACAAVTGLCPVAPAKQTMVQNGVIELASPHKPAPAKPATTESQEPQAFDADASIDAPLPEHAIARLGRPRKMLSAAPRCVDISPDGKLLAIGLTDGSTWLWDA
jgi:hypothetical protein